MQNVVRLWVAPPSGKSFDDPYGKAVALLRRAERWATEHRLHDADDRRWRQRGVRGARDLACAVLTELRQRGAVSFRVVDDLLGRRG